MGYRIVGALDTETTNINDLIAGYAAFPVLFQLGTLKQPVESVTPKNAYDAIHIYIFRDCEAAYSALDDLRNSVVVPVILVHNLAFDMYSLAPYFTRNECRVLAKTSTKPISIQILDANNSPCLVFLDTLGLFMKSLATLGEECGMKKAVGDWDYNLIRSPETPLTEAELNYAKHDIYTLLCYMGYFLRQNPDINPFDIGLRVQTKTGIVRAKRMKHLGNLKGKRLKYKVQQYWHLLNKEQVPKTDDELFTMHASTRGGFTFCAKNNASKVFHAQDDMLLESYDSTSQHPAQMCSHLQPMNFVQATPGQLDAAFSICVNVTLNRVLEYWLKPFPYAFYGCFHFENLRPKAGTIFEREGIFPLASARITSSAPIYDNQASSDFKNTIAEAGYKDRATNARIAFGKLEECDACNLFITELEAWIISRCYEWDYVSSISGYISSTFRKPSDLSLLSVMRFYKAKDALKEFQAVYKQGQNNNASVLGGLYPESLIEACKNGTASNSELHQYYMLAKADLNALFGIEATNECRRDFEIHGENGLELVGENGLENMPKSPKCFYQYGQRIVGWSRVAQVAIMELITPYVDHIICGDTDSLKIYYNKDNKSHIERALTKHAKAVDKAKQAVCARIRNSFPAQYNKLDGIGHYVFDGAYDAFSASWNKSYIALKGGKCKLTIAGIPTARKTKTPEGELLDDSYNDFCNKLLDRGYTFDEIASLAIGYNVTIGHDITKLNLRIKPDLFGEIRNFKVKDYLGKQCSFSAPVALALFPASKTIGDTTTPDNAINCEIAKANNPHVNVSPVWVRFDNGNPVIERG